MMPPELFHVLTLQTQAAILPAMMVDTFCFLLLTKWEAILFDENFR